MMLVTVSFRNREALCLQQFTAVFNSFINVRWDSKWFHSLKHGRINRKEKSPNLYETCLHIWSYNPYQVDFCMELLSKVSGKRQARKVCLSAVYLDCYGWALRSKTRMEDWTVKPSMRRWNSSWERAMASSELRGHWYTPSVSRFTIMQKPSWSKQMPLMQFRLLPQNRKSVPYSSGSRPYSSRMIDTSPVMPRRRSVLPHLMMTRLHHVASLSIPDRLQNGIQGVLLDGPGDINLAAPDLKHELRQQVLRRSRISDFFLGRREGELYKR